MGIQTVVQCILWEADANNSFERHRLLATKHTEYGHNVVHDYDVILCYLDGNGIGWIVMGKAGHAEVQ